MKLEAKDYTLSDTDITGEEEAGAFGEGPTVDVDEFDRIVGDALDDVEHVTEDAMLGARGEIEEPIVKLVSGILINAPKNRRKQYSYRALRELCESQIQG